MISRFDAFADALVTRMRAAVDERGEALCERALDHYHDTMEFEDGRILERIEAIETQIHALERQVQKAAYRLESVEFTAQRAWDIRCGPRP